MTLETISRDIALAQVEFATLNAQHYVHRNAIGRFVPRKYVMLDDETEKRIGSLAERLRRLHRIHGWLAAREMIDMGAASCNGEHVKAQCS